MHCTAVDFIGLSDESLMTEICLGREHAFVVLYKRYSQRLLLFFYRMLGNNQDLAEDFLQDIFLKIVEKPEMFQARRTFAAWIFTVANNMIKNEYRRQTVRKCIVHEEDLDNFAASGEYSCEGKIDSKEFNRLVLEELALLGVEKQSTFLLRFQEQFSIKEISRILGCSEGTVKSRLFYTTKHLAHKLQAYAP